MRELWAVKGPYWTLPIGVEWSAETDVAKVRMGCGVPLLNIQKDELASLLSKHGRRQGHKWFIVRARLEKFAVRWPDRDPEVVVEWRGPNVAIDYEADDFNTKEQAEFCQEFAASSGIFSNAKTAEVVWVAFCNFALGWMINKCRPIPMGFAEVSALPLRIDWQHALSRLEKERRTLKLEDGYNRGLKGGMRPEEVTRLIHRGVCDLFLNSRLTAWNPARRLVQWSLNVQPLPQFELATKMLESERFKKRSRFRYFRSVLTSMKAALPIALKLYAEYLYQIRRPFVVLGRARGYGHQEQDKGRAMGEFVEDNRFGQQIISPDLWDIEEGQGAVPVAPPASAVLPEVPNLRQGPQNLWDARCDDSGNGGTAGLPVRHALGEHVP